MNDPLAEIDIEVDYEKYLRGCAALEWRALGMTEFTKDYVSYRPAKDLLDALNAKQLPWIKGIEALRLRFRWTRTARKFTHLHDAVELGGRIGGDDGLAESGVTAPIAPGPKSRAGSARLELPSHLDGEAAA